LVLLVILFWLIHYQNLPENPLNGPVAAGPVSAVVAQPNTGNTAYRIIRILMIGISIAVISAKWSVVRSMAKTMNPGFWAFMVLAPLSAVWSIEPGATLLRFTTFACVVMVCFAISVAGWERLRLQQVALPPLMCILVASLVLGAMYPDRIIETGTDISQNGSWHGISFSKNIFGMVASAGVILSVHRWLAQEGRTFWSIAGSAAALACLLLSRSNTSLFAAVVGVFFMVLVLRVPLVKRRYTTLVVVGIATTILVYELVIQDVIPGVNVLLSPITALTGKDTTFSARTFIWNIIKEHIRGAPWLGSGYAAYWTGPFPSSPSYVFMYLMYFYPTESHNGYLEIVNDLGLVGLGCLLVFMFYYVRHALELMRSDRNQAALYLALLFQEMVVNMSESDWFSRSSSFITLILATFCLSRALLEQRLHSKSAGSVGTMSGAPGRVPGLSGS
jgi:exopolysaccharide production protein ExoQ